MKETILITGANGEVGHALIERLSAEKKYKIAALDIASLDPTLKVKVDESVLGNILDKKRLGTIFENHKIDTIFHLAAILSTAGEKNPEHSHKVNVEGTLNLLQTAVNYTFRENHSIKFIFPSSIAVYGLPDIKIKKAAGAVKEEAFCQPRTMYGANKLYCELLGRYYSRFYGRLKGRPISRLDFRCLRFPGIISATSLPTGGTSDFAPEMIHAAAAGKPYKCFVRPDTKIPFLAMPDAIKALIALAKAPRKRFRRDVYNVSGFSASVSDLEKIVKRTFPATKITYKVDKGRQAIVDSWPEALDDSAARRDWGWLPDYDMQKAFKEYLIPTISKLYR